MIRTLLLPLIITMVHGADFSGSWKLEAATRSSGESLSPIPLVTLGITATDSGDAYNALFRAGNRMMGGFHVDKPGDTETTVTFAPLASTRMMPPPEFSQVEAFLSREIQDVKTVTINPAGELVFAGTGDLSMTYSLNEDVEESN